jgi:predicted sulfurtransferase
MTLLKKLFTQKATDQRVDAIYEDVTHKLEDTAKVAKRHRDLLQKNGVTLRIYIATGGDKRHA